LSRAAGADEGGASAEAANKGKVLGIVSEVGTESTSPAPAATAREGGWSDRWAAPLAGVVVAVLTVYLAFNAGGFFPGAVAYATIAVAVLLVLAIMLVGQPLVGSPPALLLMLGSLAGFAALTFLSGSWSHSWSRAIIEFDRVLLYVLVLAFFGTLRRREGALEWGLRGFVLAAVIVCAVAWLTRVAPDVWPIARDLQPQRLSFPLTYWNALGLLSALASIATIHLTSGDEQGRWTRIAGAALPLTMSTLLLTFSRSSLALTVIGIVLYLALVRPKRAPAAGLALAVPVAVALVASLRANTVSSAAYTTDAGIAQGHRLAAVVVACVIVSALLRWAALRLDDRLDSWQPRRIARGRLLGAAAAALAVVLVVGVAAGGVGWTKRHWDSFVSENNVGHIREPSGRLASVGNNGRIPQWRIAVDSFDEKPLLGTGAGTYALQWEQHRPSQYTVVNAHSLYVEVMGELGVVGLVLLLGTLITLLVGVARRSGVGSERQSYRAFLVLAVVWMLHAGVDWDWQMPAITLWLFALGGLALSRPVSTRPIAEVEVGRFPRIVAAICVGVLAVTPVAVAMSQVRLESALKSLNADDCPTAISSSLSSLDALSVRPEPYEIIGYCDVRLGQYPLARAAMESAISRDPENWEMHYGLAMALAAAGKDPMPQLRRASRLNPLEPLVNEQLERFGSAKGPAQWRKLVGDAGIPL
jgi:O-antigen ligase